MSVDFLDQNYYDLSYTRAIEGKLILRDQYKSLHQGVSSFSFTSKLIGLMSARFTKQVDVRTRIETD